MSGENTVIQSEQSLSLQNVRSRKRLSERPERERERERVHGGGWRVTVENGSSEGAKSEQKHPLSH